MLWRLIFTSRVSEQKESEDITVKKKSYAIRLGVLALALTLITTCLMGGTMARYVTEVSGSATATVAKWEFSAKSDNNALSTAIDLGSTTHRNSYGADDIKDGVIAPGTSGSFNIELDAAGSEVGVEYDVVIKAKDGTTLPSDLAFKVDNTAYTLGNKLTGAIDVNAANQKKTVAVSWEWPFGTDDTTASNDNDYAGKTWYLDISITGRQAQPTATVTP